MIPLYINAILLCALIRLISPWLIIRILKLPAGNFGDFITITSVFYCKKKLNIDQPKKKYLDLVYIPFHNKTYNKQLEKMFKRKLNFLSGYLLHPISKVNTLIPGGEIHSLNDLYLRSKRVRNFDNLLETCKPLEFIDKEEIYGRKMLKKFGLKDEDKFVCFDVRDGAYQLQKIPKRFRDWSIMDYRHTDINKFVLAAEELTQRGYYVFRMGVAAEKPFISNNPKIIDYANSNFRSDFMDIYLGAKCSFCITTGTGFQDLPTLFKKPTGQIYTPVGEFFTYSERFIHITKHHILKKEKRELPLSEIFSLGAAYALYSEFYEQKGIELVENTQEEIKDLALEVADYFESKRKLNPEDEKLKSTFRSLYASKYKNIDYQKITNDHEHTILHGQIKSSISLKFLKQNKSWLQ